VSGLVFFKDPPKYTGTATGGTSHARQVYIEATHQSFRIAGGWV